MGVRGTCERAVVASVYACALCCVSAVPADARVREQRAPAPVTRAALPAIVLRDYAHALATLRRPKALSFDYTVSQLGLHDMEQTHHVYRSGLDERDETRSVVVNGNTLGASSVRIIRNRTYRYDVDIVAPRPDAYAFAFAGADYVGGGFTYRFRTLARGARAFAVSQIDVDGRAMLPSAVHFRISGGGARGEGALLYGRSDAHWVVREATVTAKLANGSTAHERIVWSNYRFYDALPNGTFALPVPATSPSPGPPKVPREISAPP